MPVYLKDDKVLLHSGMVAVDAACCCNTGACCHDSSCDIETEADCTGSSGTYQGDGTVCDPNPCPLPNCACGFSSYFGFLGEHYYQFSTVSVNEVVDCPSSYGTGSNVFSDTRAIINPELGCPQICYDSSGECNSESIFGDCHKDYVDCHWQAVGPPCPNPGVDLTCFGLFDSAGLGWCCTPVFTVISDSEKTGTCHCVCGSDSGADVTITVTLSGICNP